MYTRVVLAASKFISFFSPKTTTTSASKPKETSVLDSKNIHAETRQIKFLADYFPTVSLFVFVFEILTITVVNALIPRYFLHKFFVSNFTMFNASHV